jgi:hypothetical protein
MIRKPPADWNRLNESTAIGTVRTAAAVRQGGRRGGATRPAGRDGSGQRMVG